MIFFAFSFLASVFGGLSARHSLDFSFQVTLSVDSFFSGIIAFWPFIVALVLLLLVILWYQSIKNMQRSRKRGIGRPRQGTQSVVFLGIVTVFVVILLAAPYYLESLDDNDKDTTEQIDPENRVELTITVHGMTCEGCESLIQRKVGELDGVENVTASHVGETVNVVYDKGKLTESVIAQTIENTGYTVVYE
ncbi:MAG: cation transporter [Bacteroidales bacterium]|nr:cation transporter [Bacteroidales bacterium]